MNLLDFIERKILPDPWAEGEKIPWHDAEFSSRMLKEHLSQAHDAASRRAEIIDQHVNWIHEELLSGKSTRVLDLGCGPGLYTERLAVLGHDCYGIDYGPASIAYARKQAENQGLSCQYFEEDVRSTPFGSELGLVMMIHGELTVFRPHETRVILTKAFRALKAGGRLLVEVHPLAAVRAVGERNPSWYSSQGGLFSDRPHIYLREAYWNDSLKVSTERFYILDGRSGEVTRYAANIQGYSESEFMSLFEACGFTKIVKYPSLMGNAGKADGNYVVYVANKT